MDVLDKDQALAIMGFTGITTCPFDWFHEDVERRMGRGVWTHEMASKDFWAECKEIYRSDFIALCAQRNDAKGGV